MLITNRGGHNEQAQGADSILNEVKVDRLIRSYVDQYIRYGDSKSFNVTPGRCDSLTDLKHGVNNSNAVATDIFASIHLNAGAGKGYGVEVCYVSASGKVIADRICAKVAALGFTNRGAKLRTGLYELNNTKATAVIVECFFLDRQSDVDLYNKVGVDRLGKAIAEGLLGKTINSPTKTITKTPVATNSGDIYRVVTGSFKDEENADKRIAELKKLGVDSFKTIV